MENNVPGAITRLFAITISEPMKETQLIAALPPFFVKYWMSTTLSAWDGVLKWIEEKQIINVRLTSLVDANKLLFSWWNPNPLKFCYKRASDWNVSQLIANVVWAMSTMMTKANNIYYHIPVLINQHWRLGLRPDFVIQHWPLYRVTTVCYGSLANNTEKTYRDRIG